MGAPINQGPVKAVQELAGVISDTDLALARAVDNLTPQGLLRVLAMVRRREFIAGYYPATMVWLTPIEEKIRATLARPGRLQAPDQETVAALMWVESTRPQGPRLPRVWRDLTWVVGRATRFIRRWLGIG